MSETSSVSGYHFKSWQRHRERRYSSVDSSSDYYYSNSRCRPRAQSLSLNSQLPPHLPLHIAPSVPALGTISENEMFSHSPYYSHYSESVDANTEYRMTPIFRYTPTPVIEPSTPLPELSSPKQSGVTPRSLEASFNFLTLGRSNPSSTPIHISEPIAAELVPVYLNPHTGQVYSRSGDYFKLIANQEELLDQPPQPVWLSKNHGRVLLTKLLIYSGACQKFCCISKKKPPKIDWFSRA